MPELPEVETVRRRLAPLVEGRAFARVEIADARLTRPHDPLEVAGELDGERVETVDRRGKYLIVRFESGRALVIHLRMTGSLRHVSGSQAVAADASAASLPDHLHQRAVVMLDDKAALVYSDVRRFGTWLLLESGEVDAYIDERVGPEPLGANFGARHLGERLARRRAPVKAVLLDQRALAGVGNIYADEALWRARVHPLTPADELEPGEVKALHRAVRKALEQGIARQGSTLCDYRLPDGGTGEMQHEFKVYGRAGEPCDRCGTPIDKIRVAGRGTWYCPNCQVHRPL
ncbi:MAG: bifunctional DNA-formamidopyrimidine glycosylase/DNA-(apurinic or apyrimidinic site) lyase [Gaiellaceae bacterium]